MERINNLFKAAYNKPEFSPGVDIRENITILDTFYIPESIVENNEKFLEWFEPRFSKLKNEEDFRLFSSTLWEVLNVLDKHPYLLSPRLNEPFLISKSVKERIRKGFNNVEEIRSFFKKVALKMEDDSKLDKFFSPDRRSKAGGEKLSVCRILSVAYVLDYIRQSQDFKKFIEYTSYVLGRSILESGKDSGILSNLVIPAQLDIFSSQIEGEIKILDWLAQSQLVKGCYLNNIGGYIDDRGKLQKGNSYFIPEVHMGLKSGFRAFLKLLRDPKADFRPLDDFLRLRFIFKDSTKNEEILNLICDLIKEAEIRDNPLIKVEVRAVNYFTDKEIKAYFPKVLRKGKGDGDKDNLEEEEISPEVTQERTGIFDIKLRKNISSGKNYKNISLKIYLVDPQTKKSFFGFEIQIMREKEFHQNERQESSSNHFIYEMNQFLLLISRMNGKLMKEEIARAFVEYFDKNISTEKMPSFLIGEVKYPSKKEREQIRIDFSGTIQEKAEKLFNFFVVTGVLRHVAQNFPSRDIPKPEQRRSSGLYIHEASLSLVLDTLGYPKRGEKKRR